MIVDDIAWRLAQLASLPFQERYVINGTADEYILDTELLENVDGIKYLIRQPDQRSSLSQEQLAALNDLGDYLEAHSGDALSGEQVEERAAMIRGSEVWTTLRAKSALALEAFGIPPSMSVEDIDKLSS